MLYKFFWCQWLSEQKDDWVNVVRKDLKDFGICLQLNQIEKYSSQRWKIYIKKSARKYEFRELLVVKDSKNKTKKLVYENLEMQDYLKCFEKDLSQVLLRYRMSMSNFSGNFKNGEKIKPCPLCSSHEDIQDLSFQCPKIKSSIVIDESYENIFSSSLSVNIAKILKNIEKLRNENINSPNGTPVVHQI